MVGFTDLNNQCCSIVWFLNYKHNKTFTEVEKYLFKIEFSSITAVYSTMGPWITIKYYMIFFIKYEKIEYIKKIEITSLKTCMFDWKAGCFVACKYSSLFNRAKQKIIKYTISEFTIPTPKRNT